MKEKDHSCIQKETELIEVQVLLENSTLQLQQDRQSCNKEIQGIRKETELQRFRDIEKEWSKWEEHKDRLACRVKELEQHQKKEEGSFGVPLLEAQLSRGYLGANPHLPDWKMLPGKNR